MDMDHDLAGLLRADVIEIIAGSSDERALLVRHGLAG